MDKLMEEEDLKGLEEEIDNAVDRLFVERKKDREESFLTESPLVEPPLKPSASEPLMEPPVFESQMKLHPFEPPVQSPVLEPPLMESPLAEPPLKPFALEPSMGPPVFESPTKPLSAKSPLLEPSYEFEKGLDIERTLDAPPAPPVRPAPAPFLKSIDRMEAQLLSLEWEITGEKLEQAKKEIVALKGLFKQKTDITTILSGMEDVINHMMKNEEDIRPPWIKFLLDSKETIKLLMRKEADGEMGIYQQLAYLGIEARFSCLEGMRDSKIIPPPLKKAEIEKPETSIPGQKMEEISKNVNLFMQRIEEIFGAMQQQILKLGETSRKPPALSAEERSPVVHITIFKVDEKLFGVESEKVFKLFKVPKTFEEKYSDRERIRLRDFEVKMVNLRKLLAIEVRGGRPKEQIRILTVKEDGEYKGFMVDEVLKNLSAVSEKKGGAGVYFSGVIHSTYQEQAVEIPILDLKKF